MLVRGSSHRKMRRKIRKPNCKRSRHPDSSWATWLKFSTAEIEEAWNYKLSSKDIFACKQHLHNWPHRKLVPVLASLPLEMLPPLPQVYDRNLSSTKENSELLQRNLRRGKEIDYHEAKSDEEKESDSEYQPSREDSDSSLNVKQKKILKKKEEIFEEINDCEYEPSSEDSNSSLNVKRKKKEIFEKSMTEYEKKIQKNIEERLMFIKSLKLDEAKQDFLEFMKKPKRIHRPVPLPPPREKSSRLLQKEKVSYNLKTMFKEAHKKAKEEAEEIWGKKEINDREYQPSSEDSNSSLNVKRKKIRKKKKEISEETNYCEYQPSSEDSNSSLNIKRKKEEIPEEINDCEYEPSSEDSNSSLNVKRKKKEIFEKSMTEYEKKIQKNIEERLMFMKSLKLDEAKQDFLEFMKKPKRIHRPVPLPPPREKSSRLLQREKVSYNLKTMFKEAHGKAKEEAEEIRRKKALISEIVRWYHESTGYTYKKKKKKKRKEKKKK